MSLSLKDKYVWDLWIVQEGRDYHIFYLQASRSLEDPNLRHWNVSIGHAVSQDLKNWFVLPDALSPNKEPSWDDYTTWTGSIIFRQGLWYMLYTGGSRFENGQVQRIGLATSKDLTHWERHSENPVIEADSRWYELLSQNPNQEQVWRDPYIFKHPDDGDYHSLITARIPYGPSNHRGVIAHIRSQDLIHWESSSPITDPGRYGYMEVPQWIEIQGRFYLLYSVPSWVHSNSYYEQSGRDALTGTYYMVAENPLGPFKFSTEKILYADDIGSQYAGKLVKGPQSEWYFLSWTQYSVGGTFVGEIADPLPVTIRENGDLFIEPCVKT